jgi:glycosyltransferase involved in cell wall biosynthesis
MARKADALIAVSQHTKDMIVEHLGVSEDRIFVARHGVDPHFRRLPKADVEAYRARSGLQRPYLLFVGTAEPRKNLLRLVDAYARLRHQGHDDLQLVVAGKSAWGSTALREHIDGLGLAPHVRLLGYVPAEDLPLLYNGADVFSLPSIAEGYGMPLLEAMACGVPVVASNLTALPEVFGDAAIGVDPLDSDALAEAIDRVRGDTQLRLEMVARGLRRAASLTWESSARQTVAVFERFAK